MLYYKFNIYKVSTSVANPLNPNNILSYILNTL